MTKLFLAAFVAFFVFGCSKPVLEPAPVAPAVQSDVPVAAQPAAPVVSELAQSPTVATPAPKVVSKPKVSSAERLAYKVAFANAAKANKLLGEHCYNTSSTDKAPGTLCKTVISMSVEAK